MAKEAEKADQSNRDFRRTDAGVVKEKAFPASAPEELRVHIAPAAYDRMKKHAATTSEVELCGVLVGQVGRDAGGFFLAITGVIEGEGAKNLGSQVTFTHETWNHIHEVKDRDYPDARIVGWYHTHPGFGVFLSSMDTFIHENFFSEPYQVAIVLETVRRAEGCFAWIDGKCTALRRYWVGDREVSLAEGDVETPGDAPAGGREKPKETPAADDRGGGWLPSIATVLFLVLGLLAGIYVGQTIAANKMEALVRDVAETEVYDVLAQVAVYQAGAEHLKTLGAKVKAAGEALAAEKTADAKARLAEADADLAVLQKTYEKPPAQLKQQLLDRVAQRQMIGTAVQVLARNQAETGALVGDLYMMRLEDILGAAGPVDLAKMPAEKRTLVSYLALRACQMNPGLKAGIQEKYKGLIEQIAAPGGGPAEPAPTGT